MPPGSSRSHSPTEKAPLATRSAGSHLDRAGWQPKQLGPPLGPLGLHTPWW